MNESPYRVEDGEGLSSNFQTLENALKYSQWLTTRRSNKAQVSKLVRVKDGMVWDHESKDWHEEIISTIEVTRKVKELAR